MSVTRPIILWARLDLRLSDHPALCAAVTTGRPVVHCYVLDDATPGRWAPGAASRWWLHYSLAAFQRSLAAAGGVLVLRRGRAIEELPRLASELKACAVYWTRGYEPFQAELETKLRRVLRAQGTDARRFGGALLFEPEDIRTGAGGPFKVFTPFWKACRNAPPPNHPVPPPERIESGSIEAPSLELRDLRLLPTKPDWSAGLTATWTAGERVAQDRLQDFADGALAHYVTGRDRPDEPGTSRLSPHLHFGEISPRQAWHSIENLIAADPRVAESGLAFLRELAWREFAGHMLFHYPDVTDAPFRETFAEFPWRNDEGALRAWQQGMTGYPLVDAGMRELWSTGWMHNRVRMVAASFLTKHLLIAWQRGEAWFWDTLVDADLASNAASWQWVAGCGADAAPYFRVFNPVLQGTKFDPQGHYVRRWVPELAGLADRYIHRPWQAPAEALRIQGIRLGKHYPLPVVDHAIGRTRALDAYSRVKAATRAGPA